MSQPYKVVTMYRATVDGLAPGGTPRPMRQVDALVLALSRAADAEEIIFEEILEDPTKTPGEKRGAALRVNVVRQFCARVVSHGHVTSRYVTETEEER